jgi:hypothetical protein
MKKEDQDYFEALGELEYWYFLLRQLVQKRENQKPQSALDLMIDSATGYGDKILKEDSVEAFEIYENIIRLKKILGRDDWEEMQQNLDELKVHFNKLSPVSGQG